LQRFADGDDDFRNSRLKLIPSVPKVCPSVEVFFLVCRLLTLAWRSNSSGVLDSAAKCWKHTLLAGESRGLQLFAWS
jgi:hypothetical protein